jgi:tetratricopeptide (TPR) repeat protein
MIFLAVLIASPYVQMESHQFINWDDPYYVSNNPVVSAGLSLMGVGWAFITGTASNWHPLTWISHMLDSSLFGPNAKAAHMVNLLWYMGCVILAFFLFLRLEASTTAAFFMAAFFGLHPLHVESVAWAAERKDLLCAFFFLATMLTYLSYARRQNLARYLLVTGFFVLSLLSKPMAVTWPCVALLLDYWPLKRFNHGYETSKQALETDSKARCGVLYPPLCGIIRLTLQTSSRIVGIRFQRVSLNWSFTNNEFKRVFYEKIPWIALSIISSIITIIVQNKSEAVKSMVEFPILNRLANAAMSYFEYIRQSLWPLGLTVFYPYPYTINALGAIVACCVFVLITAAALWQKRQRPYLLWGWLFYLGVLVPVVGFIQVGAQAHADRYTLLPQLGLILAIGLLLDRILIARNIRRVAAIIMSVVIAALMILTFRQVSYWQDSKTLFYQNLEVVGENDLAHFNLGTAYFQNNQLQLAVTHFLAAARINPADATTYNNMGMAYARMNQAASAETAFKQAIFLDPKIVQPHFQLAVLKFNQGHFTEAAKYFDETARLAPEWTEVRELRDKARELASGGSPPGAD